MDLRISYTNREARQLLFWLIGFECAVAAAYVLLNVVIPDTLPGGGVFDMDMELSIPTWFSTVQLFALSVALFLIARNNRQPGQAPSWLLYLGSALFLFLSADEGAGIHERITDFATTHGFDWMTFSGGRGAWIGVYAAAAVALAIATARGWLAVWRHYPRETRLAVAGALVLVAGAVGVEIVSYLHLLQEPMKTWYMLSVAMEELMEMMGVSIILYAVLLLGGRLVPHTTEKGGDSIEDRSPALASASLE